MPEYGGLLSLTHSENNRFYPLHITRYLPVTNRVGAESIELLY